MDFDPLYLRNCKFLDHSSYGNFDQHWIAIPTVYKLTWFGGTHFTAKENADVSIHVTVQSVSVKKNRFLWSCNEVSRFYRKLNYHPKNLF